MSKIHQIVITNPELCIGCKACEKACVKESIKRGKLGITRIRVFKVEKTSSTNQCRQCDDAPCAVVCPSGALQNLTDFVHLNEHLCVGCGLCTVACPYGAVSLDSTGVFGVEKDANYLSQPGFPSLAVKCDICDGREEGSACVEACPKGAIIMLDSNSEHKIGKKLKNTENMQNFIKAISDRDVDLSEFVAPPAPKPAPEASVAEKPAEKVAPDTASAPQGASDQKLAEKPATQTAPALTSAPAEKVAQKPASQKVEAKTEPKAEPKVEPKPSDEIKPQKVASKPKKESKGAKNPNLKSNDNKDDNA
ncbi:MULTISPECIES: 4Fe-4S dicluster domain-containing protein [unclassified Campylobacter]|uniref:4Fe-4S dicluster domain-containing protein n=1 Tax=unclassified Campylobacter TaxID=2593542 RepID=UPI0022E9FE7A|nr:MULTISPECIES: 4Fe-4S binding protein [unclassified Campylobacter]MDA3043173.1 4Fe-4S binding protein [Campylobacter sp. JMF_09 ED2]MDA3044789.1 4Fe-4S binding protein [Campylobacter sp. JMF_07 ED4]MDA3063825.1 4Fe-4S binding protein [Campylobacter sp. JMF_11 EL3]MDA3072126.1 4Fe-4S binding protein [Campylobacter sp. VBCF_03 NA9]MDA3075145.1 4Fe-4S binding protein [Campylobacter sp. JMF_05 ED3]